MGQLLPCLLPYHGAVMARDFAKRAKPGRATGRGGGSPRRPKRRAATPAKRKTAAKRNPFHGPSFSAGIVLGGALVVALAYVPTLLEQHSEVDRVEQNDDPQPKPSVEFRFDERLRSQKITADSKAYVSDDPLADANIEYLIQAASFQNQDDADTLRAQLLLNGLPAATKPVTVGDKPWYRVTVGPFPSSVESGRAMTKLRELDLDAFLIKREVAGRDE